MVDYTDKDTATENQMYSKTVRRVAVMGEDGLTRASKLNPIAVNTATAGFSDYEAELLAPGASATDYSAKTDGSMFAIVETSYRTIITNNDSAESIVVRLNLNTNGEITIAPGTTFEINSLPITDIFMDTTAGHTGTVEVVLFG